MRVLKHLLGILLFLNVGIAQAQPGPPSGPFQQDGQRITPLDDTSCLVFPSSVSGGCSGAGTVNFNSLFIQGLPVLNNFLPTGEIWIGGTFNIATAKTMTGDCSLASSGVITCSSVSGIIAGTTAIASGHNNGVAYQTSGGKFNVTTSTNNGVLSTDSGGVPSIIPWTSMPPLSTSNTWTLLQKSYGATTTTPGWEAGLTGDTFSRVAIGLNSVDTPRLSFGTGSGARDAFLSRAGAANLRFGSDDAASPVAQTISMQNVVAGTSNTAGADTTFQGSLGTGTGVGGAIIFKTSAAAGSGTSQNSAVEGLRIGPGKFSKMQGIVETVAPVSIISNVLTIDLSSGATIFTTTSNANISTLTITGVPTGATAFQIFFTANGTGFTQTYPASVKWPGGALGKPTLSTTNGAVDSISFVTIDSGTTWYGFVGGVNFQ